MPVAISNLSSLWTNSANTYNALSLNVTTVAYEANSKLFNLKANGNVRFTVDPTGRVEANLVPVPRVHMQNTAPSSPFVGDEWINLDTGQSYKYTNDGNSNAWVQFGVHGIGTPEFSFNLDGGFPDSQYGGVSVIDAGALT